MDRVRLLELVVLITAVFASGFAVGYEYRQAYNTAYPAITVKAATTTSLYQTGLLQVLLEDYRNTTGVNARFEILAKGSGEALRLLADGSACIGFVHAPSLELKFINSGSVERMAIFAYNEFVIVGPADDPADVKGAADAVDAFKRIYTAGEKGLARFVSRGDLSGTNVRELIIWNLTGLNPEGRPWYFKSAKGMAETLIMADDLRAYTLTDIGTFNSLRNQGRISGLVILLKDPKYLVNVYSLYLSKAKSCDNPVTWYVAFKLRDYVLNRGQDLIAEKFKGLFNPVRGSEGLVEKAWEELSKMGS